MIVLLLMFCLSSICTVQFGPNPGKFWVYQGHLETRSIKPRIIYTKRALVTRTRGSWKIVRFECNTGRGAKWEMCK